MEEASVRHSSVAGRGDEPGPVARGRCALDQELFVVVELCLSLFKKIYIFIYLFVCLFVCLFVWLHQVFSCDMQDRFSTQDL